MNHVIAFNSPPSSGKDTIGIALAELLRSDYKTRTFSFKDGLYRYAHSFVKEIISYDNFYFLCTDRILKEENTDLLFGFSPRNYLIHVSEKIAKRKQGSNVWVNHFIKDYNQFIEDHKPFSTVAIITDMGFQYEYDLVSDKYQTSVVSLFRNGCTFENDSRNYIDTNWDEVISIDNNSKTPREIAEEIKSKIRFI